MDRCNIVADSDELDRVTKSLMTSLRQSKALNNQIREASWYRGHAHAPEKLEHRIDVLHLPEEISRHFE